MTVDQKENEPPGNCSITIIDTIGPMIAEILKEAKKNSLDIKEMKTMLKRLSN